MSNSPWDQLPTEIAELKAEVERLSGREVYFQWTDDGASHSTFEWSDEDIVVFVGEYSHAMAAEELLHIQMDIEGYPCPRIAGRSRHLLNAATHLHNEIQHAVIFPKLEAMGYSPRVGEGEAVAKWVRSIRASLETDEIRPDDPHVRAMIAILYVRVQRNCDLELRAELNELLFENPKSAVALAAGQATLELIANGPITPVANYECLVQGCLRALGISHEVSLGDPRGGDEG